MRRRVSSASLLILKGDYLYEDSIPRLRGIQG